MKHNICLLSALLLLAACSHTGEPRPEAKSQDATKGAIDDPDFFERMLGRKPPKSSNGSPQSPPPKDEDSEEEDRKN